LPLVGCAGAAVEEDAPGAGPAGTLGRVATGVFGLAYPPLFSKPEPVSALFSLLVERAI